MLFTDVSKLRIEVGKLDSYNSKELIREMKEDGRYDYRNKQPKKRTSNRKMQA